jgi:hypothetical protein
VAPAANGALPACWSGSVRQGSDGLVCHNHHRLDGILEMIGWEAEAISRTLGTRAVALLRVHGAHVQRGRLVDQGVAIVPACSAPRWLVARP